MSNDNHPNNGWVLLTRDVEVEWSGAVRKLEQGSKGRILKTNDDGTYNVSFGMTNGIHTLSKDLVSKGFRVLAVEPKKSPYVQEMTFQDVQKFVQGYVEEVFLYGDIVALVNEDGMPLGLNINRNLIIQERNNLPLTILGNFVVVKKTPQAYVSLNDKEVEEALKIFQDYNGTSLIYV